MKIFQVLILLLTLTACNSSKSQNQETKKVDQAQLTNPTLQDHKFLECMYRDPYFPTIMVDKCNNILLELSYNIERDKPRNLEELYTLSHAATIKINNLQDEFYEHGSEIETGARECLAANFETISTAYGFNADIEELIAPRDW